ncbi:MAG: putative molybdopterin biosynthesis protein [Cryomorphaceae bacterium]|jgi:putative molybdopterin biosynthesis protein
MQINNLRIVPNWRLEDLQGQNLHVSFLPLLAAIKRHQKLTAAAEQCGVSYRHAWNILRDAEAFFGHPVTLMERGRGASLTELGRVLLQANQRIEARVHTQMESLAMELNAEVHRVLLDQVGVIPIYASHGYAVALVPDHLEGFQVELHYHGPADALRALNTGACSIAGFNLPLHHRIASQQNQYLDMLDPDKISIRRFIKRQQGLMIAPEVVDKIKTIADLQTPGIRFINRQPRSGTRELLDQLLLDAEIDSQSIRGYDNHEYTHSAVAAHVATGMAEVGFGVKAAASRFDLDFLPITEDRYYWAYRRDAEQDPEILAFNQTLISSSYQDAVNKLPGYECEQCGEPALAAELFA